MKRYGYFKRTFTGTGLFCVVFIMALILAFAWPALSTRWENMLGNTMVNGVALFNNGINERVVPVSLTGAYTITKAAGSVFVFDSAGVLTGATNMWGTTGATIFVEALTADHNGWRFAVNKREATTTGTTTFTISPASGDVIGTGDYNGVTGYAGRNYKIDADGDSQTFICYYETGGGTIWPVASHLN